MSDFNSSDLAQVVREIEQHASDLGWDRPLMLFALVPTLATCEADPEFAATISPAVRLSAGDGHLTPLIQDEVPDGVSYETLLPQIEWPEQVVGAAVVMERLLLRDDDGGDYSEDDVVSSASREDMRLAVGVTRGGESWCVIRLRSHDNPEMRIESADSAPGVVEALAASLR